jgi:hypothetical protein
MSTAPEYGTNYWLVDTPSGKVWLYADTVSVGSEGELQLHGHSRGGDGTDVLLMCFSAAGWLSVEAASVVDGTAVAAEHDERASGTQNGTHLGGSAS